MKDFPGYFDELIRTRTGTSPHFILCMEWESGDEYYSEVPFTFGSDVCNDIIISLSPIITQERDDGRGISTTLSVSLDGTSYDLKSIVDTLIIEGTVGTLYQTYDGLLPADSHPVFKGIVRGDISYNEGERLLTFNLEPQLGEGEIGYEVTADQLPDFVESIEDAAWPLGFGHCLRVPAVRVAGTTGNFVKYDLILKTSYTQNNFSNRLQMKMEPQGAYTVDDILLPPSSNAAPITLTIGSYEFTGYFDASTFTSDASFAYADFVVKSSNVPVTETMSRTTTSIRSAANQHSYGTTMRIAGNLTTNLVGKYVGVVVQYARNFNTTDTRYTLGTGTIVNKVTGQSYSGGITTITFAQQCIYPLYRTFNWNGGTYHYGGFNILSDDLHYQTYSKYQTIKSISWYSDYLKNNWGDYHTNIQTEQDSLYPATSWFRSSTVIPKDEPDVATWNIDAGTNIDTFESGDKPENTYIFNIAPTNGIIDKSGPDVVGYKKDKTTLVRIPTEYYTVLENRTNLITGQTVSAITVNPALSSIEDEEWSDEIFISFKSNFMGGETNTANQIRNLINNYMTGLVADDTTFDAVATKIAAYPSHFVLYRTHNVLDLIFDMAWQARCALWIDSGVVYITYLSEEMSSQKTIDSSDIDVKSATLSFTQTEGLITKLTGTFRVDHERDNPKYVIYKNTSLSEKYGLQEQSKYFFIYNIKSLVEKSVNFWGYRMANLWRYIMFTSPIDLFEVDINDCVTIDFDFLSTNNIRGLLKSQTYDLQNYKVASVFQLASKAGDVDGSNKPNEDDDFWTGINGPSGSDISPGDPEDQDEFLAAESGA
jgi:hypothetical protein